MTTDFLVIGSGIAGLTYALKVAEACPDKKITILTKTKKDETNTKYAQGGIAGVTDFANDSFEEHIQDTLISGDGLGDPTIVEIVIKEGVQRINELIEWGAHFDTEPDGDYMLGKGRRPFAKSHTTLQRHNWVGAGTCTAGGYNES